MYFILDYVEKTFLCGLVKNGYYSFMIHNYKTIIMNMEESNKYKLCAKLLVNSFYLFY